MPIYVYRCACCSFQNEHLQKMSDALLTECPECGEPAYRKMLTAAGFQLKGSGWYATDFKGGSNGKPAADSADAGAASKTDTASDKPKTESASTPAAASTTSAAGAPASTGTATP
ncbi:MAG: zinc ribbon domain-containing protein [Betaproteobacteria bacterium]|nr:zinc ribbon domain-containing protein [Betaproteobacteria bacterium]